MYGRSMSSLTFYWHDYETFGINPRWARPSQFAGVRTDDQLNIIGDPLMIYCHPSTDALPDPQACLVTGITPQLCVQKGLPEYQFARKVWEEFSVPGTCGVGYNSIRFDDEFTRHLLYRNFYDPYAREWQGGNSRWDLIDVVRLMYALRPEGMTWPVSTQEEDRGRPIFKLEELSKANGLQHESAHDALSDVIATIELAKKIRSLQPRLFDYALSLRDKRKVAAQIDLDSNKPIFHVSSKLNWRHGYASLMMPICKHPTNSNGIICYDLMVEPAPLMSLSAEEVAERVFTRNEDLPEGVERIPLKTIHLNKSPMVGSVKLLDGAAAERLNINPACCEQHWQQLLTQRDNLAEKVSAVMNQSFESENSDPEFNLYAGFLSTEDKQMCDQVRACDAQQLAQHSFPFEDGRLAEMLFRYKARNFPASLSEEEMHQWEEFRFDRLNEKISDDAYDLETYHSTITELQAQSNLSDQNRNVLEALSLWGDEVL